MNGISSLTSLALVLSFAVLSLVHPAEGRADRSGAGSSGHLRSTRPVAGTITEQRDPLDAAATSLGVTIVAAFNAVVVGLAALLLGVPLAGTIAVVTFVTAYIPYIGAFVSGAFAVVIALGARGHRRPR